MKIIIYIPGLGYDYSKVSGYDYAERYRSSLDKMNTDKSKKYLLENKNFKYGFKADFNSKTTSIFEYDKDVDTKKEVTRVYEFYYLDILTKSFKEKNILLKIILVVGTLLVKSIALFKIFFKNKYLNWQKILQSTYFLGIWLLIAFFSVLSLPAILTTLLSFMPNLGDNPLADNISEALTKIKEAIIIPSYWLTSILAIIALVIPNFRGYISTVATQFLCLDHYLTVGENKLEIIGQLEALVEKIAEENTYDSLEVHGYSFGSIIALDTIFPFGNIPVHRIAEEVKALVTIGCPHDFIKVYYARYFQKRRIAEDSNLKNWTNIYSKIDILSSNFRSDNNEEDGSFALETTTFNVENVPFDIVNPDSLSFWNHLALIGIRAHSTFWGKSADASNCLHIITKRDLETAS